MPFYGRERELQVADAIIGMRDGAACVFVGRPGIGKSSLAQEIARRYDTAIIAVSASERLWPLSGLSAFAAGLGGARGAALDTVLARGRDWPEHLLAEQVSRTLHLVHDDPRAVVIDDLDAMDNASLTVLSFVCARLRGTGVGVLATIPSLDAGHDFGGMTHTTIDPLSFEESIDLARSVLGAGTSAAVLQIVAACTGGDPGLLTRVNLTPAEAAGDESLPLPLRVVPEAHRRTHRMPRSLPDPRVSAVIDLLSVGPVYSYDRIRSAAAEIGAEIDELIDRGVVTVRGDLARVSDPAVRLRHHAALSPEDRRRLHARAADDHGGDGTATRRWHESFLDPAGDRRRLLAAAVEFARSGDTLVAVEFAERALGGRLDEASRDRGLVDLGDALVLQGQDLLGQYYLGRAGDVNDVEVRVRAAIATLRAGANVDHVVRGVLPVGAVLDGARGAVERLLCESARLHLSRGEIDDAVERVVEIGGRRAASRETMLLVRILEGIGVDVPVDLDAADTVTSTGPDGPIEIAALEVSALLFAEKYADLRRDAQCLLNRTPRPAPMWRERMLRLIVASEVRGGDPFAAREAVMAWQREWLPGHEPDAARILLLAQAAAIDPADRVAADLVRQGKEACRREGTPALLPFFAAVEGGLALADGRFDDAATILRTARASAPSGDPAFLRTDADLIEALWLGGRSVEARRELARLEQLAGRWPRRWTTLAIARSRAVCRSDLEGLKAFREAEVVYRTDDAPDERRRLQVSRERCLSPADHAVLRASAHPAGVSGVLSAEERDVVTLVERGLRNREIASTLFISLRSVELRLTRIYRKLGVASRTQLVAHLHGAASA